MAISDIEITSEDIIVAKPRFSETSHRLTFPDFGNPGFKAANRVLEYKTYGNSVFVYIGLQGESAPSFLLCIIDVEHSSLVPQTRKIINDAMESYKGVWLKMSDIQHPLTDYASRKMPFRVPITHYSGIAENEKDFGEFVYSVVSSMYSYEIFVSVLETCNNVIYKSWKIGKTSSVIESEKSEEARAIIVDHWNTYAPFMVMFREKLIRELKDKRESDKLYEELLEKRSQERAEKKNKERLDAEKKMRIEAVETAKKEHDEKLRKQAEEKSRELRISEEREKEEERELLEKQPCPMRVSA